MSSNDEPLKLFLKEVEELKATLESWTSNIEKISMAQIVEIYYKVINVNSLVKYIQNLFENPTEEINAQIITTKNIIEAKFNKNIHPQLLKRIEELIEDTKNNLKKIQSQNNKTKEEIETQAQKYEDLRKMMSTKEFVEQYSKGIHNQ